VATKSATEQVAAEGSATDPTDPTDPTESDELRAVDGRVPGRRGLATRARLLEQYIEEIRPHVAIALGMARDSIEIELSATNRRHPERRDNAGALAVPPRPMATKTLRTALPVDRIVRSSEEGSVRVSEDAGGYLCEEVFFALQSVREKVLETQRWPLVRSGFIHVPNDRHIADEEAFERLEKRILHLIDVTIADLTTVV